MPMRGTGRCETMKTPDGWTHWHPKHEKTFGPVAVPTYAVRAEEECEYSLQRFAVRIGCGCRLATARGPRSMCDHFSGARSSSRFASQVTLRVSSSIQSAGRSSGRTGLILLPSHCVHWSRRRRPSLEGDGGFRREVEGVRAAVSIPIPDGGAHGAYETPIRQGRVREAR